MKTHWQVLSVVIFAATALAVAGCGGGNGGPYIPPPDTTAPGPVTAFTCAEGPGTVDLFWVNPVDADFAGVMIVLGEGADVTFVPVDGTAYAVMDPVGSNQTVMYDGVGTSSVLLDPGIGTPYEFAAWTYDTALNYSTVARDRIQVNTLGSQLGTLSIDMGTGVVTVTSQPADLILAGSATYNSVADELVVTLDVLNDTARLLFNLKALILSFNEGTTPHERMPGGPPYRYYGPEALDVGVVATNDFTFEGITAAVDPIVIDLQFVDAPMLYGANYGADFVTMDTSLSGETHNFSFGDEYSIGGQLRQGVLSPDHRFIYAGEKQTPFLNIVDTRTITVTGGVDLSLATNGLGNVGGIDISADGHTLYVVFNDGTHWHGSADDSDHTTLEPVDTYLIALSEATLVETARIPIRAGDAASRTGREVHVSPDGTTLAVLLASHDGVTSELWLLDLATMTFIDTDPGTIGTQPVTLSPAGEAIYGAWAPDGSAFYVGLNDGEANLTHPDLDVVDMATFAVTQLSPTGNGQRASPFFTYGNRVYYASREDSTHPLTVFDIAAGTQTQPDTGFPEATGCLLDPRGDWYYVMHWSDIAVMDLATNTRIDVDDDGTNGTTNLDAAEEYRAHMMVITDY
jgi:hypothetical protein